MEYFQLLTGIHINIVCVMVSKTEDTENRGKTNSKLESKATREDIPHIIINTIN